MPNVTITQLPVAGPITGTESIPIVQDGQTRQTTAAAIAASPAQFQTFLTLNQEPTLPNSRRLSVQTGLGLTDNGALSTLALSLNGASGALETALTGIVAKTGSATVVARTLTASGLGLSITDGNGVSGNPTFALTGQVAGLANLTGPGMMSVGGGSVNARVLQGTAGEISVANGDGFSNPTFRLALNPVIPGTAGVIIPVGTTAERGVGADGKIRYNSDLVAYEVYSAGNWDQLATSASGVFSFSAGTTGFTPSTASTGVVILGGTLNVANGGTGQTTYTDGQLLIGNSTGNTLATSTLTAGSSIAITNGPGSITISIASTVAITGGTINNTIIGGTTPAAGTFTSVTMTSGTITTAPVNGNDIVNKTYADSIASGINFHQSCRLATTAALPSCTYNNGTSGVGATLTATANGPLSVDTTLVAATNRILVKNQANAAHNGVYTVTQVGDISPGAPFILTRATDFDSTGSGVDQIDQGDFFLITAGSTLANTSWVQQTPLPITIGTTGIVFSQFGAPLTYSAGTGLNESPAYTFNIANTGVSSGSYGSASSVPVLSVNAQGQITTAVNTSIAISASQVTSGALAVVNGGTGQTTYTDGQLLIGNSTGNTLAKSTLTQGSGITITNGSGAITIANASPMTYPAAGIPNSTGSAWGTSYSTTGSGTVVALATSPSFTTPSLGAATATSINKVALTAPAGGSTLTIADTKTLTVSNTLTFTGTDGTSFAYPGSSGTVVTLDATQTLTNKRITARVSSTSSISSPLAWNSDNFDQYAATAQAGALTINADSGTPTDGQRAIFRLKDNGTPRALTWTTGSTNSFQAIGVTLPTTTVANKTTYVGVIYNASASRWDAVAVTTEA